MPRYQRAEEPDLPNAEPERVRPPAPSDILALQRSVGNAAVVTALRENRLQRNNGGGTAVAPPVPAGGGAAPPPPPPNPRAVPREVQTPAQADDTTLMAFQEFTERQVDWASQAGFQADPARTDELREVIVLANEGPEREVLAGCGPLKMRDLRPAVRTRRADVEAYGRAVAGWHWQQAPNIADALVWGDIARRLSSAIGDEPVKRAVRQDHQAQNVTELIRRRAVDDFIEFCRRTNPILSATNGAEVNSYLALRAEGNPLAYAGNVGPVRNVHHFEKRGLDALVRNRADTSRRKPLAVVLHAGVDHSGAFHRDPNMTQVLAYGRRNTQLVEGPSTLNAAGADFTAIVDAYGKGTPPQVQQVMIAGHGNSRTTELAGGEETGSGELTGQAMDLDAHNRETVDLIDTIVDRFAAGDPNARIVLNGCLTASSAPVASPPRGADAASRAEARRQLTEAIAARRSLADTMRDLAARRGIRPGQVSAANSSFGSEVSLMDPRTGELGLHSPGDPAMTVADKFDYVSRAGEATGALRALLEILLLDQARAVTAMQARLRISRARTTWDDKIIKACYREVLVNPGDIAFASFLGQLAGGLSECQYPSLCTPHHFTNPNVIPADVFARVMARLERDREFTGQRPPLMALSVYQVWMTVQPDRAPLFLRALGQMTANTAALQTMDLDLVRPHLATLLPDPPSANAPGELRLALLEVNAGGPGADQAAINYLRRRRTGDRWTDAAGIERALGGLTSASDILASIREVQPGGGAPAVGPVPNFNIDVDGDGVNDMYVIPLTARGQNVGRAIGGPPESPVHARPNDASPVRGNVPANGTVPIIGQTDDREWYVIEFGADRRPGFVKNVLPL